MFMMMPEPQIIVQEKVGYRDGRRQLQDRDALGMMARLCSDIPRLGSYSAQALYLLSQRSHTKRAYNRT